jgi:hypothetical protein
MIDAASTWNEMRSPVGATTSKAHGIASVDGVGSRTDVWTM